MLKRKTISCEECQNLGCLVKNCSTECLVHISDQKNQILIQSGESIFREDAPILGLYFIQEGHVKMISSDLNGNEQIVRLASQGEIIGHRSDDGQNYEVGAVALTDLRVCFVNNELLNWAFRNNYEFLNRTMIYYSNELKQSELRFRCLAQMTVEEKVAFTLLYIASTLGYDSTTGELSVSMTRSEIGAIAGTNADQVSRMITSLKKQRLIDTVNSLIFIKRYDQLNEMLVSYGFNHF